MTTRRLLLLLMLAVAAGIGWWWLRPVSAPAPAGDTADATQRFDYYVRGLAATTMDEQGRPARTLRSARLLHYPDDDHTELTEPRLTVHQAVGPPWQVSADDGWVNGEGTLVLLTGNVRISREAGPDNRPMLLVTEKLRIRPEEDYAETDEPVRVTSLSSWVEATGMQAWLREPQRIKLLSNARGHYVDQE